MPYFFRAQQAATYLASDLISQSFVAIPYDLYQRSPYVKDACDITGVGLLVVRESGAIAKEQSTKRESIISSVSLWGNRRNGAPDTSRVSDLKLPILAIPEGLRTKEEIISYIQRHRTKVRGVGPMKRKWAEVFIYDATQMGLIIRRLDGTNILSPLGKTLLSINPNSNISEEERNLMQPLIFNFAKSLIIFEKPHHRDPF